LAPGLTRLLRELAVVAVAFALVDGAVRHYARTHFVAPRKLAAALAAGDGCVVFSGGSDLQSALDVPLVAARWRGERPRCIADLSLGGTTPDVRFMAFRRYLEGPRRPATLVVGFKGHDLADERELDPGHYLGSDAAVYEWGRFSDLPAYYPTLSMKAVDNAVRFALMKATAIGAHRQAAWIKLDALEQRLGLVPKKEMNALGNVEAFRELEQEARSAALARRDQASGAGFRLAVWSSRLIDAAQAAGARVSFVRLPGTAASERAYFADAAHERRFDDFMAALAREHGGVYLELAHAPWMNDALLVDGLHYAPRAAELISEALANDLGH